MWNFKSYLSKQPEMKMTDIRFLKYDKYAEISFKKKFSGRCRNSHSPLVYISENISFQSPSPFILSICILCLSGCLFVCLYPINVKTAEPSGAKFFVGPCATPGLVYGWSNYQNLPLTKFDFWKFCPVTPAIFSYHFVLKLISNPILFNRKCITFCSIYFSLIVIVNFILILKSNDLRVFKLLLKGCCL